MRIWEILKIDINIIKGIDADKNNICFCKLAVYVTSSIFYYETKIIRDSKGRLIQPEGLKVPAGHSITFLDNGVLRTESSLTSYSFLAHETKLNDDKRNINILRTEYLNLFLEDFANIMEYQESNQFVSEDLKKTENPRIISP